MKILSDSFCPVSPESSLKISLTLLIEGLQRPPPGHDPVPNEIIPELLSQIASEFVILEKVIVLCYDRFLKVFHYVFEA